MQHSSFATTTRGLDRSSPSKRLYEKAKKLGIWNPADINFSKDKLGVYLLSRLIAERPNLWEALETQMNSLLPFAIGVIGDAFAAYEVVPFGLVEDDFVNYAMAQFSKRFERLEKAKGQSLDEVSQQTKQIIEAEDA